MANKKHYWDTLNALKSPFYRSLSFIPATVLVIVLTSFITISIHAQDGQKLFEQNCASCHTISDGKLVGPDLAGVNNRKSEEWLIKFIQNSQQVIESGDEYAQKLFEEYNQTIMPPQNLSDQEVKAVLSYIEAESPEQKDKTPSSKGSGSEKAGGQGGSASNIPPVSQATKDDVKEGRKLFTGAKRLQNDGPSCATCHDAKHDNVLNGGTYAKDLTRAYKRLGEAGVESMIQNPSFPEMKESYDEAQLTDQEVFKLKAFLQYVSEENIYHYPNKANINMLSWGIGIFVVLLLLAASIWAGRKTGSVNDHIYERQVKSK